MPVTPISAGGDSKGGSPVAPDPHGEAALMLVECLIHELLARSTLSHSQALNAIRIGIDAQIQASDHRGEDPTKLPPAAQLLSAIYASLEIDARPE